MGSFRKLGILAFLLVIGVGSNANAEKYAGSVTVARIRIHPLPYGAYFGLTNTPLPTDVCSLYGESFRFDHTTSHGKSLLATLLTAKVSGKLVDLWYSPSSAPGKNETNGCNDSTISTLLLTSQ